MATLGEYVRNTLNDPRFVEAPYSTQLQIRQKLFDDIEKYDPNFKKLPYSEKREFQAGFMTNLPISILQALQSQDPKDQEAINYALKVSAGRPESGGKSGLNFMDGFLSGLAQSRTLTAGLTRLISSPLVRLITGETRAQQREIAESPIMQDALLYEKVVDRFYNVSGKGDYNFGNLLFRGLALTGDMASMMATYGTVGAPGYLTKWIPRVANAVTKSAKASTYLQWGLQAATETLGFVGEDLAIDLMSSRFKEADSWAEWKKELGGDVTRGFLFFSAGELFGGLSSSVFRGAAKGVTGLSAGQSLANVKKLTSEDTITALRSLIANDDPVALRNLRNTARQFGGEDAVKELDRGYRRLRAYKKYGGIVVDDLEATKFILGQELDIEFEGSTITRYADNVVDIKFTDLNDLKLKVDELGVKFKNKNLSDGAKVFGDRSGTIDISATIAGKVKNVKLSAKNAVDTFYPRGGIVDEERVRIFLQDLDEGLLPKKVQADVFNAGNAEKGTIFFPDEIRTKQDSIEFAESFEKQLAFNDIKAVSKKYKATAYLADINPGYSWTEVDIQSLKNVDKVFPIKGKEFQVDFEDGTSFTGTLNQLGNLAQARGTSLENLNKRLVRDFGLSLELDQGSRILLKDSKKVVSNYKDIAEFWRANPRLVPKKASSSAPQFIERANKSGIYTEIEVRNIAHGDVDTVLNKLDAFENSWHKADEAGNTFRRTTANGNEVSIIPETRLYHVKLSESGMTKTFDNLSDTKKYLRKDMRKYENLTEEFLDKFALEIRTTPTGHYIVYGDGMAPKSFKSLDDIKKFAAKHQQNLDKLKSTSGLTDAEDIEMGKQIGAEYKKILPDLDKGNAKSTARIRAGMSISNWWTNNVNSVGRGIEKFNIPKLSEAYQNVIGRDKLYRAKITEFSNLIRHRMSGFSTKERLAMGQILGTEVDAGQWQSVAKGLGIDLKPDMHSAMQEMRGVLDDLGVLFGIPPEKWIKDYLPRIRDIELADIRGQDLDDPKWVQRLLDPNHKMGDIDPFFEHIRVEDIYALKLEWDLEKIMNIYARIGYRKRFLGEPLKQLDDVVRAADKAGDITKGFRQRLDVFKNSLAGRFIDTRSAEQYLLKMDRNVRYARELGWGKDVELKDFTEAQIKVIERTINADVSRGLSTLQTSALMSFKVWMPLRNVSQINHVGAIYSNPMVLRSVRKIIENPEKYWKEAVTKGYLQGRHLPGKDHFLSFLEGVNTYGTRWFRNSDDYTRIVGMVAVNDSFNDALKHLSKGDINVKKFLKRTHAEALDKGSRDQFMNLLSQGKHAEASGVLERNIIDWTMYNYSMAQKPAFAHHNLGKAMLSYSTYPIQFSEMFARMVKIDPLIAVRLTANLTALSYFYNDVTGVKGFEGNPLKIVPFMGGPLMTGGLDAVAALAQGLGSVARLDENIAGKMNRLGKVAVSFGEPITRVLVPFNWYPKRLKNSLQSLDSGEYYTGLMQFSGLNMNSDAIIPNVDLEQLVDGVTEMGF